MQSNEDYVIYSDFALRTEFPFLSTRIFEISPHRYLIVFEKGDLEANAVQELFAKRIRVLAANVALSNDIPEHPLRELKGIGNETLRELLSITPATHFDLVNLIASKFPGFELLEIRTPPDRLSPDREDEDFEPPDRVFKVVGGVGSDPETVKHVEDYFGKIRTGVLWKVVIEDGPMATTPQPQNSGMIAAQKLTAYKTKFIRHDEELWHSRIDRILDGSFINSGLEIERDLGATCLLDFSQPGQQMNIRQAIMLYDTVLAVPPDEDRREWERQTLGDAEFLQLIESGRLKFVLTGPEQRTQIRMLEQAFEISPDAVIGRRHVASVLMNDIVRTASEYKLNDPSFLADFPKLSMALSEGLGIRAEDITALLLWPIAALRGAVVPLTDHGARGLPSFGVNNGMADYLLHSTGHDRRLEMSVPAIPVHLAHAFGATAIAPTDQAEPVTAYQLSIADRLNFYRSFNIRIAAVWAANERRKESRVPVLPALPLFEFEVDVPMRELLTATALGSDRRKGRALISRLADLPLDAREAEVSKLASELRRLKGRQAGLFSLESFEDMSPILELFTGVAVPPYHSVKGFIERVKKTARRKPAVDCFLDGIERDLAEGQGKNQDIDFLQKVDRIATLNRPKVS